jgi:delta1-piperideine-2-carboxylate reductase
MTRAEEDGCASHRLFRLAGYLGALRIGKANGRANPAATQIAPGVVRIDGARALAPLALSCARDALAPLARAQGVAAAAICDVFHFSAMWTDIEDLVADGLGALCMTAYLPFVAPFGARKPAFGTNPFAFGFPNPEGAPFLFDFATAATARGELQIAAREGKLAPEGAGVDADGRPTRDPLAILAGAQLPFGGHKGAAFGLMIELLAGVLIGQPTSLEAGREDYGDDRLPRGGVMLIAFDPARFGDAEGWRAHAKAFETELRGLEGVRLPGDRRIAERARMASAGVRLPPALWESARAAAGY